jgi:hypothetical protein
MSTDKTREALGTPVLRRYEGYGLLGGVAIGLLLGVLLSGPHFFEWPVVQSLAVVFGSAALCAGIGWVALGSAAGTLISGAGMAPEQRIRYRYVEWRRPCWGRRRLWRR